MAFRALTTRPTRKQILLQHARHQNEDVRRAARRALFLRCPDEAETKEVFQESMVPEIIGVSLGEKAHDCYRRIYMYNSPLYYAIFFLWVYPPKICLKLFFDYFCKYHDGRGLGKKWCVFDHLGDRKRITSIYKRDVGYAFYFQSQTKENLRGGILRDRKNLNILLFVFCNLVTSEHRIKFLIQWVHDNVEKNWSNESWHYDHYVWMWQNLLLMILMNPRPVTAYRMRNLCPYEMWNQPLIL